MQLGALQNSRLSLALGIGYAIWLCNGVYLEPAAKIAPGLFWALDIFQWVLLPSLLWAVLLAPTGLRLGHIGFAAPNGHWLKVVGQTAAVFYTAGFLFFIVRTVAGHYFAGSDFMIAHVFPSQSPLREVAWLYAALTAGVVESALFIGMPWLLWQSARRDRPVWLFVLSVSVLFAAAHWEHGIPTMLGALATQVISCAWFLHYRNLWAVASSHVIVDLIAFS